MGDGTEQNPYTREDVLRLIEENGGTAKELDLSGKWFEKGTNLSRINLKEAVLEECHLEGVQLTHAHFEGAFMSDAHLEDIRASGVHFENTELLGAHLERARLGAAHLEGAEFFDAHLEEATLVNTFLDKTRLSGVHLQGAHMHGAKFTVNTEMESVDWGDYILGEEKEGEEKKERHLFEWAEHTYRRLKQWHTNAGMYDIAGEFFFREMTAQRKRIKWKPQPWHRAWSAFNSFVSGYGERPLRVVRWGALILFGAALLYFLLRGVAPYNLSAQTFLSSLYYSAVSFTALGYGPWFSASSTRSWVQGAGAVEAFIGVFTIALFLITFTRKMRR